MPWDMHRFTIGEWEQICDYFNGEDEGEAGDTEPVVPSGPPSAPPSLVIVG